MSFLDQVREREQEMADYGLTDDEPDTIELALRKRDKRLMDIAGFPPARDANQTMAALALANAIRSHRRQLKAEIKAGTTNPASIFADPPPEVVSMKVFDLLLVVPGLGKVGSETLLYRSGASWRKTVGGLSPRQRNEIVRGIEYHMKRRAELRAS